MRSGMPAQHDAARLADLMGGNEIQVTISLDEGSGQSVIWTCDLSREYVTINM
jgi:N-acetylglutamate synthase/N-acetylornithine aminotransferase